MSIHEECGVFGIYSPVRCNVAQKTYYGLYALQRRGQESCGIVVNDDGLFFSRKDTGLVGEVFTPKTLAELPDATMAVGHVRYSTTGNNSRENAQPIVINHHKGRLAICHNGNLANAGRLRLDLESRGAIFHTTSDTETIAYLITRNRLRTDSIEKAVMETMEVLEGAFSLVLMSPQKLICARDPLGFRPLCYGKNPYGEWIVASESCALHQAGVTEVFDVKPGQIIVFDSDGVHFMDEKRGNTPRICIFEYIYFARPDSVIENISVQEARKTAGRILADVHPARCDAVIGAPDSGLDAALGYSSESGIPYEIGLIKNKYIGRTFIAPSQEERCDSVRIKLSAVRESIDGKRIVLVDDSIVRGNTMKRVVAILRQAGAREIHVRISSPRFLNPCYYGTDIDSRDHLISCRMDDDELCSHIGADSLGFLPVERLPELAGSTGYCSACFDGNYPTETYENEFKSRFERPLSERRPG